MNAVVKSKTFRAGNSEAVRLPKEVAFGPGVEVTIEKSGDVVTIRPVRQQDLKRMVAELMALPRPQHPQGRLEVEIPDRTGR